MSYFYRRVPLSEVPLDTRAAAVRSARRAARRLRIRAILRWVRPTLPPRAEFKHTTLCDGFAADGTFIYIRADISPRHAAHVAAHEMRHLWQHRAYGYDLAKADAEKDAERFAHTVAA